MIRRTQDAEQLNRIVNHPDIRPFVADMSVGELDLSPQVANAANICLVGEFGAFLCFKFYEGCYEVHTQVLPEGRGEWTRRFAETGAHYMFTATDCVEILTRVPEGHMPALALTKTMGFRRQFTTPPEVLFLGNRVTADIWSLTIQEWAPRAEGVEAKGGAFHDWLNRQVEGGKPHPPDSDHNRIVGITLDMMRAGQIAKGVVWYNRWAFAARHPAISLVGMEPPQVRFDAGILTLEGGAIRFEPCH